MLTSTAPLYFCSGGDVITSSGKWLQLDRAIEVLAFHVIERDVRGESAIARQFHARAALDLRAALVSADAWRRASQPIPDFSTLTQALRSA
jgi:nicotinic acid mononucleotide adenylyltransferase